MKSFLLLLFTVAYSATFAQNNLKTSYFDAKNKLVKTLDEADYLRTTSLLANGLYSLVEKYKDGSIKREGTLSAIEPSLRYVDQLVSYYKNGNKQSVYNYNQKNRLEGEAFLFSSNGNLKEKRVYQQVEVKSAKAISFPDYKLILLADSLGHNFLDANGNGQYSLIQNNGNTESGEYLDGYKTGLWKTYDSKLKETYEDEYLNGGFIKGRTINADGTTLDYDILEILPTFNGGVNAFGKFIGKSLNYPPKARDKGEQGRVIIGFNVEKDGSLSDIKVLKSESPDLDAEALRVIKLSSSYWTPGIKRGKPIKLSYTVPIYFQLQK